jgi:hypothetical protein
MPGIDKHGPGSTSSSNRPGRWTRECRLHVSILATGSGKHGPDLQGQQGAKHVTANLCCRHNFVWYMRARDVLLC